MSNDKVATPDEIDEEIVTTYKPPPEKSIEAIIAADQDDESLRKYKEALLGQAQQGQVIVGELFFFFLYSGELTFLLAHFINLWYIW